MMTRPLMSALVLALSLASMTSLAVAQKAPKIKETVTFATSWDAAVTEAKLLNLPIVVHSHGFK